jgi:hypothetical protein
VGGQEEQLQRRVRHWFVIRMIHAAQKASEMARNGNQHDGEDLERPARCGEKRARLAASFEVHAPDRQHQQ